jgi:hypothetical protein
MSTEWDKGRTFVFNGNTGTFAMGDFFASDNLALPVGTPSALTHDEIEDWEMGWFAPGDGGNGLRFRTAYDVSSLVPYPHHADRQVTSGDVTVPRQRVVVGPVIGLVNRKGKLIPKLVVSILHNGEWVTVAAKLSQSVIDCFVNSTEVWYEAFATYNPDISSVAALVQITANKDENGEQWEHTAAVLVHLEPFSDSAGPFALRGLNTPGGEGDEIWPFIKTTLANHGQDVIDMILGENGHAPDTLLVQFARDPRIDYHPVNVMAHAHGQANGGHKHAADITLRKGLKASRYGGLIIHGVARVLMFDGWPLATPRWLREGVADYLRLSSGFLAGVKIGTNTARYDDGGGVAAYFLLWLESEYGPGIVADLCTQVRSSQLGQVDWVDLLGTNLETAWQDYREFRDGPND